MTPLKTSLFPFKHWSLWAISWLALPVHGANVPFWEDASLKLALRTYAEDLHYENGTVRSGMAQAARLEFESKHSNSPLSLGVDLSLYAAASLKHNATPGNMAYVARDGSLGKRDLWAYPGIYALKLQAGSAQLKLGQLAFNNPFLVAHDVRALPATFRGALLNWELNSDMQLEAGSTVSVYERGRDYPQALKTAIGGTPISRFSYLGMHARYAGSAYFKLYAGRAEDVWDQYFVEIQHPLPPHKTFDWRLKGALYHTRNQGTSRQGEIKNTIYNLSVAADYGASNFQLSYQHVASDQFMDFIKETSGIRLPNAEISAFNAPHEKSVQFSYTWDGVKSNQSAWKLRAWMTTAWGADASNSAALWSNRSSKMHSIYWRNEQAVHGSHHEFGLFGSYHFRSGSLKESRLNLYYFRHLARSTHSDPSLYSLRIMWNVPLQIM